MNIDFTDPLTILLVVAALIVVWLALRFVLKLAAKIFACGCAVIAVIAVILLVLAYAANS